MGNAELSPLLAAATAPYAHLIERLEAELRFATDLTELHPDQAGVWLPLISQARERLAAELRRGHFAGIAEAVTDAESLLAPVGEVARTYTVHCAGHAHIDMNWMWSWPETVSITVDSFLTVLRLMEEYPDFCFSQSQASTYAIVEKHRPDILARIAARVREGRWEVTASHWVEGDKNLASGESLCRHLLYTRQYMQQLFGLTPEDVPIDWSPDTFGHAITVPTYLVRGGIRYLYLHRPGGHGPKRPWLFWWQAPDGSRVLVRNDSKSRMAYNGRVAPEVIGRDLGLFARETGLRDHLFIYGVGDHGGGPTRRDLHQVIEMSGWPIYPRLRFSTVKTYMQTVEAQAGRLPVLDCELNFEFAGCYTTQTLIKRDNRFGESRLVEAEAAAAMAWAGLGAGYPSTSLRQAWRDVLFSHFHDILPGSGVRDTRAYTHGLYQEAVATTAQIETQALRELAARIDTGDPAAAAWGDGPPSRLANSVGAGVGFRSVDGALVASDQSAGSGPRPFVLFNPTAIDRREVVQATIWANGLEGTRPLRERVFSVSGPDGAVVPAQLLEVGGFWGHEFAVLAFPAQVPGLGYARYTIEEADGATAGADGARQTGRVHHCPYSQWERSGEGLENDLVSLEVNPISGGIARLVDKRSGCQLIGPEQQAPALEYVVERPHGMTAWLIGHQGAPPQYPEVTALRRSLGGPHVASIEVDLKLLESEFTLTYELRAGDPRLHVGLKGTWFQRGTPQTGIPVLNFVLPLALAGARASYEVPFGAIERDLNQREEVPALRWARVTGDLSGQRAGVLLLNDCKHGHSLADQTLRLTLIRSSYDPDILPEIGQHEVHLAVLPFGGATADDEAIRQGQVFNHSLRVVSTDLHKGPLPPRGQFLAVGPEGVLLSGVKKAEADDALVVRVFNPADQAVTARVTVASAVLGRVVSVAELDLMERPLEPGSARVEGGEVCVTVPRRALATVAIRLQRD